MKLNARQLRFIEEYLRSENATKAYIAAGYSQGGAGQAAHTLLKRPEIQIEIRKRTKKINDETDVTLERLTRELASIAFGKPEGPLPWPSKVTAIEQLLKQVLLAQGKPTERTAHQIEDRDREQLLREIELHTMALHHAAKRGNGKSANGDDTPDADH